MALPFYLALTDWEFQHCTALPEHTAWMACHFSSRSDGLSNIPKHLPEQALLMVNDQFPPDGHDPVRIARQLANAVEQLSAIGVVLDLQRPESEETAAIASQIQQTLPCPIAVTPAYWKPNYGAVFLPPVPVNVPLSDYLKPWQGTDIWLEAEKPGIQFTLTENGCKKEVLSDAPSEPVLEDADLCCHYQITVSQDRAVFSLYRTKEDQHALLSKAKAFGVSVAVGLYQEFR